MPPKRSTGVRTRSSRDPSSSVYDLNAVARRIKETPLEYYGTCDKYGPAVSIKWKPLFSRPVGDLGRKLLLKEIRECHSKMSQEDTERLSKLGLICRRARFMRISELFRYMNALGEFEYALKISFEFGTKQNRSTRRRTKKPNTAKNSVDGKESDMFYPVKSESLGNNIGNNDRIDTSDKLNYFPVDSHLSNESINTSYHDNVATPFGNYDNEQVINSTSPLYNVNSSNLSFANTSVQSPLTTKTTSTSHGNFSGINSPNHNYVDVPNQVLSSPSYNMFNSYPDYNQNKLQYSHSFPQYYANPPYNNSNYPTQLSNSDYPKTLGQSSSIDTHLGSSLVDFVNMVSGSVNKTQFSPSAMALRQKYNLPKLETFSLNSLNVNSSTTNNHDGKYPSFDHSGAVYQDSNCPKVMRLPHSGSFPKTEMPYQNASEKVNYFGGVNNKTQHGNFNRTMSENLVNQTTHHPPFMKAYSPSSHPAYNNVSVTPQAESVSRAGKYVKIEDTSDSATDDPISTNMTAYNHDQGFYPSHNIFKQDTESTSPTAT